MPDELVIHDHFWVKTLNSRSFLMKGFYSIHLMNID